MLLVLHSFSHYSKIAYMCLRANKFFLLPKNASFLKISSSFSTSSKKKTSGRSLEKPEMFQLEHVQKRLEFTVCLCFPMKIFYTFKNKSLRAILGVGTMTKKI